MTDVELIDLTDDQLVRQANGGQHELYGPCTPCRAQDELDRRKAH